MCFGELFVDEIVSLIFNVICLVVVIFVSVSMERHLRRRASVLFPFKMIFLVAVVGTVIAMICSVCSIILCPSAGYTVSWVLLYVGTLCGVLMLFTSLKIALAMRLHVTFKFFIIVCINHLFTLCSCIQWARTMSHIALRPVRGRSGHSSGPRHRKH